MNKGEPIFLKSSVAQDIIWQGFSFISKTGTVVELGFLDMVLAQKLNDSSYAQPLAEELFSATPDELQQEAIKAFYEPLNSNPATDSRPFALNNPNITLKSALDDENEALFYLVSLIHTPLSMVSRFTFAAPVIALNDIAPHEELVFDYSGRNNCEWEVSADYDYSSDCDINSNPEELLPIIMPFEEEIKTYTGRAD